MEEKNKDLCRCTYAPHVNPRCLVHGGLVVRVHPDQQEAFANVMAMPYQSTGMSMVDMELRTVAQPLNFSEADVKAAAEAPDLHEHFVKMFQDAELPKFWKSRYQGMPVRAEYRTFVRHEFTVCEDDDTCVIYNQMLRTGHGWESISLVKMLKTEAVRVMNIIGADGSTPEGREEMHRLAGGIDVRA